MVATMLFGLIALAGPPPQVCPIMGSAANLKMETTQYNGAVYGYCCGGCSTKFEKAPAAALKSPSLKGKVTGLFLFDPVSKKRVDPKEATLFTDFNGTRFYFASEANQKTFASEMKKFGTMAVKDSLNCPVSGEKIETYADAAAFADYDGVRYYFCCADCIPAFNASPAKFAPNAAKKAGTPKAIHVAATK